MTHFSLELSAGSIWVLIAALLIGTGYAVWTYRNTIPQTTRARRNTLILFRSLAIASLLFAIFQPILASTTTERTVPSIALAMDRSESMQLPERGHTLGAAGPTRRDEMLRSIHSAIGDDLLHDRQKLEAYTVGDHTLMFPDLKQIDSIRPSTSSTDLSSLFAMVRDARKTRNTEAIVLYSDGAFTAGENPIYAAEQLGVPVYAVGMGDSTEPRDVSLTELFTNEVATIGSPQPVDITLHYGGAKIGEHVNVELFEEGQKIGERPIELKQASGDEAISFSYTPLHEGIQKLTARVSPLPGEATDKNNQRLQYVKVLKNKFHVVLFAGAPSSDVSFVKQYFESNPSLKLSTFIQKQGATFYEGTPTRDSLKQVDLVVLIGFPITATSDATVALVRELLTQENRSLLYIPSRTTDFTKLAQFGDALPFRFDARGASANELKVALDPNPSAADNPVLHIPAEERGKIDWSGLAPLFKTETHIEARPESQTLAEASVQGVKLGEPLILTRHIGNARQVAITGYGLWQWKLVTFGRELTYGHRTNADTTPSFSALDLFLGNATRWLTTQEENKRVTIVPDRKFYQAGEKIELLGQVYDESYQPLEKADVTVRISGASLQKPIDLALDAKGNGRYAAAILQGLPRGDYTYAGSATLNGRAVGSDQGRFNVGDFNIEFAEPRMRSDILREMASRTGGKFYTPETAGSIVKDILASQRFIPREITNRHEFELWNSWPLFALALLFFSAEWFMRKRLGML